MTPSLKRILRHRQQLVADNMANMLQDTPKRVSIPGKDVLVLRAKLMLEEVLETIAALGVSVHVSAEMLDKSTTILEIFKGATFKFYADKAVNIYEVMDGLADLDYVGPCGTAVAFGVDLGPIFMEVHRSNTTKCWTDAEVASLQPDFKGKIWETPSPVEGRKWVVLNADGKYIKSPSYSPADIKKVLSYQL